jgi:hypothetical protein
MYLLSGFGKTNTHTHTHTDPSCAETYHMIDKCDQDVACWSESGDNFVVKDVDKFSCVSQKPARHPFRENVPSSSL